MDERPVIAGGGDVFEREEIGELLGKGGGCEVSWNEGG